MGALALTYFVFLGAMKADVYQPAAKKTGIQDWPFYIHIIHIFIRTDVYDAPGKPQNSTSYCDYANLELFGEFMTRRRRA